MDPVRTDRPESTLSRHESMPNFRGRRNNWSPSFGERDTIAECRATSRAAAGRRVLTRADTALAVGRDIGAAKRDMLKLYHRQRRPARDAATRGSLRANFSARMWRPLARKTDGRRQLVAVNIAKNQVPARDVLSRVWTYWEGACPPLIRLCLRSIERHCQARVLDRAGFAALWTTDRHVPIDALCVAHRADFIRAYLLYHYGGVWVDADCVMLRPITELLQTLGTKDLAAFCQKEGGISNSFVAAQPRRPAVRRYYDGVKRRLRDRTPLGWTDLGTVPLTAAIEAHPETTHLFEREAIMPICWTETHRYLEPAGGEVEIDPRATCYMLANQMMPESTKTSSEDELIQAPNVLGALLRKGLFAEENRRESTAARD